MEALDHGGLGPLLDRIQRLHLASSQRVCIGIVGAPGSGKSTLARLLCQALGEDRSVVVPMDGFHLAQSVIAGTPLAERRGAIDTFDGWGYLRLLERIANPGAETLYAPLYLRSIEDPIACAIPVPADVPIVITEGNYLLVDEEPWRSVHALLSETGYVEIEESVRIDRLVERHIRFGKSPARAREWVAGPDARNAAIIEGTRARADLVVRG